MQYNINLPFVLRGNNAQYYCINLLLGVPSHTTSTANNRAFSLHPSFHLIHPTHKMNKLNHEFALFCLHDLEISTDTLTQILQCPLLVLHITHTLRFLLHLLW